MDFSFFDSLKDLEEDPSSNNEEDDSLNTHENLSIDKFKKNILNYTSSKLCEIIVSHRYIGINKDLAILCMIELGRRRDSGDLIDFENEIENMLSDLPKIDLSIPDLRNIFSGKIKI